MSLGLVKVLTGLLYPQVTVLVFLAVAFFWRRMRLPLIVFSFVWIVIWSLPIIPRLLAVFLERKYPEVAVESVQQGDVAIVLGGGVKPAGEGVLYPRLMPAADRIWYAAKLYEARKIRMVILTGVWEEKGGREFLLALGVPKENIIVEPFARNTIENALYIRKIITKLKFQKILLVTSAFHMRRAEMIFNHLGVQCIPVAVSQQVREEDIANPIGTLKWEDFIPMPDVMAGSAWNLRELVGYYGDLVRLSWSNNGLN